MHADCILLIAACLDDAAMQALESLAHELGLAVLVEVHDETELERACALRTPLLGVNNRDLRNFEVNLETSIRLRQLCPPERLLVTESGIAGPTDVQRLREHDIHAFWLARRLCGSRTLARRYTRCSGLEEGARPACPPPCCPKLSQRAHERTSRHLTPMPAGLAIPTGSPRCAPFLLAPPGNNSSAAGPAQTGRRHRVPAPALRALWLTPPEAVRVVIVGQDPYHQPGQAHGLAFRWPRVPRPPSLRNILQEVARDCGTCTITDGCLEPWARQGVLLLNTVLTVEPSSPACHAGWGWEVLTDQIIYQLGQGQRPLVFMLWGAHAQAKKRLIDTQRHRVLTCNHPSPLAANRPPVPFVGCGHFGRANQWLQARRPAPSPW